MENIIFVSASDTNRVIDHESFGDIYLDPNLTAFAVGDCTRLRFIVDAESAAQIAAKQLSGIRVGIIPCDSKVCNITLPLSKEDRLWIVDVEFCVIKREHILHSSLPAGKRMIVDRHTVYLQPSSADAEELFLRLREKTLKRVHSLLPEDQTAYW